MIFLISQDLQIVKLLIVGSKPKLIGFCSRIVILRPDFNDLNPIGIFTRISFRDLCEIACF